MRSGLPRLLIGLALLALALTAAACGGDKRTAATTTATVTRTVTTPASSGTATGTITTPTTATDAAPPPNPHASLSLRAAEQSLDARGFATLTERDFRPDHTLKVLVGVRRAPPRAEQAFFFVGDRFLGTDTKEPSGAIEVTSQADDRVTLGYGLYEPGDALCCASGGTRHVTFQWDGTRLVPQDPIPSADPGAAQTRR